MHHIHHGPTTNSTRSPAPSCSDWPCPLYLTLALALATGTGLGDSKHALSTGPILAWFGPATLTLGTLAGFGLTSLRATVLLLGALAAITLTI